MSGGRDEQLKPIEIPPAEESPRGEWVGFAVLFLIVAAVFTLLLLWLTGSFLIALATSIGMIALMLGMGYLASGKLDRRR
jgi:hypothetical protein